MPYVLTISLLAALLMPAWTHASEDFDPFAFGAGTAVEVIGAPEEETQENAAPVLPGDTSPEFDFSTPANLGPSEKKPVQVPEASGSEQTSKTPADRQPIIDKDQALTETLKQDEVPPQTVLPLPTVEGTWVDKLATSNPLSILNKDEETVSDTDEPVSLEGMVDNARNTAAAGGGRSNASVFDISGLMLRMNLKQVDETMQNRGFRKIMQKYQIPNFIKWRSEENCRNNGVVGYERIAACVNDRAKKGGHQYVQTAKYQKFDTKEDIEVTFTSNFTENKVYRIVYRSQAASIKGNSPKAVYMRNIKVYDFWKKINQKYGKPDNKDNVTWGLGGNKPYLKAKTGYLLLEDPMFRELDYTRMSREDQRYMNTDLYSF